MEAVKNTINTAVDKVAAAAGSVAGTAVPQGDNPSSQDLGVDKSTVSPIHERRNSLEKQLQNRPDVQDLKNRHILLDTNAAPALQSVQYALERERVTDSLKKELSHRPERDELVQRNILPDSSAAPALLGHQKELERNLRRDSLEKKLAQRPDPKELVREGILEADESPIKDA